MCCKGWTGIIFGLLVLLNVFVWPQLLGVDGWIIFFAGLGILWCLATLIWPKLGEHECCCVEKPKLKKKK